MSSATGETVPPTDPDPRVAPAGGRRRWAAMMVISLGVAIIIVDQTIVNVALPSIIRDLGIGATTAEWAISVYALVFASLLITTGRIGDMWGRRRLFMTGAVVFLVASVFAATADTGWALIAARVVQGVGGAAMLPSSLSLANAMFVGRERAIAFAIWGSTIGGVAALGPLLGGWLTTELSWRWAFGINVPIVLAVLVGCWLLVDESKDPRVVRGFDIPGTVLSVLALGGLVLGLIEGQRYGWWAPLDTFTVGSWTWPLTAVSPVPFVFAIAIAAAIAFVLVERRRAAAGVVVLLDLELFRIPSYSYGNGAGVILNIGEFGLLFALPVFLQNVLDLSAFGAGAVLATIAFAGFLVGPVTAQLAMRFGSRSVVRLGLGLEVLSAALLTLTVSVDTSPWVVVVCLAIYGLGVGLATAQLTNVILTDVPVAQSGQASGTSSAVRQVGAALGIAVMGAVLVTSLGNTAADRLAEVPGLSEEQQAAAVQEIRTTVGAALTTFDDDPATVPIAEAGREALVDATRIVTAVAAVALAIGLLVTRRLPAQARNPARRKPQDQVDEPAPV